MHFTALILLCVVPRASAGAIAEALDSPLEWSGTGTYRILTDSKRAAIGGDAVFVESGTLSTTLPGPCDFQMRYRSQGGSWVINTGSTRLSWPVLPRERWQTISFRLRNAVPGQVFKITATQSLVDRTLLV